MNDLRIPKQRAEVEVLLAAGGIRQIAVFLGAFAPNHNGAERLSDLLNGSAEFFPAVAAGGDDLVIFNRAAIAVARVAPGAEPDAASDHTIPTEYEVEITLADGRSFTGWTNFVLPPERSRLIDFLNDGPPFFRVLEEGRVSLVNKRHVALVAPVRK